MSEATLKNALPTTMTVGGRTYDILDFSQGEEKQVKGDVIVVRAKEAGVSLSGEEELKHLLKHQEDIPVILRFNIAFIFTNDRHLGSSHFCYFYWVTDSSWSDDGFWTRDVNYFEELGFFDSCRVLRRK